MPRPLLLAFALPLLTAAVSVATTASERGGCGDAPPLRTFDADPSDFASFVSALEPGDLLRLAPGDYATSLVVADLDGAPGACIRIEGPVAGSPARFLARDCCNTVQIRDSSYVAIRNLEIEGFVDGEARWGDGVKADGTSHHITLENLHIRNCDRDQQVVGINTKAVAWNWVVRRNVIENCGTGIYLGDSDGSAEFVHGLIEENLIRDTIGYSLQIKHQNARSNLPGIPAESRTILRHNVFHKSGNSSTGGSARPNLLIGHPPLTGVGIEDDVLIYGNLLLQNPSGESLFQATGNVLAYANLFVQDSGPAVRFQFHVASGPRRVRFVQNTILASGTGVSVSGAEPGFEQRIEGNAIFAATPIAGGTAANNVVDDRADAALYLAGPDGSPGNDLDLSPIGDGGLDGPVETSVLGDAEDALLDFDARPRGTSVRGAYGGAAGWLLAIERKTVTGAPLFEDGFESGDVDRWSL